MFFSVEDFMKEVYDSNADSKQWQSFTPSAVKFTNEGEAPKEVTDVMFLIRDKGQDLFTLECLATKVVKHVIKFPFFVL